MAILKLQLVKLNDKKVKIISFVRHDKNHF